MKDFQPDYTNILNASFRIKPKRLPFYEHIIDVSIMEKVLCQDFSELYKEIIMKEGNTLKSTSSSSKLWDMILYLLNA